jgi:hypothetical protein
MMMGITIWGLLANLQMLGFKTQVSWYGREDEMMR